MKSENKWVYSYDDENFSFSDVFSSKEEILNEVKNDPNAKEYVYIGKQQEVSICGLDLNSILDNVAENTSYGFDDFADDYLCNVTKEHYEELEKNLNDVFFKWIEKYNYKPDWFEVVDIEKIKVK